MSIKINKILMALMLLPVCTTVKAQIGEHRSDFSVGAHAEGNTEHAWWNDSRFVVAVCM
mgnify:CR=1 FL=1